jgi:hypothetical protein
VLQCLMRCMNGSGRQVVSWSGIHVAGGLAKHCLRFGTA